MDMSSLQAALGEVGRGGQSSSVTDTLIDRLLEFLSLPTYDADQFYRLKADVQQQLTGMTKDHMLKLVDVTEKMQIQKSALYAHSRALDAQSERLEDFRRTMQTD
jgi:hypothetical protein